MIEYYLTEQMKKDLESLTFIGTCAGVSNGDKTVVPEHRYLNGMFHMEGSHSLCHYCKLLTYYYNKIDNCLPEDEQQELSDFIKKFEGLL